MLHDLIIFSNGLPGRGRILLPLSLTCEVTTEDDCLWDLSHCWIVHMTIGSDACRILAGFLSLSRWLRELCLHDCGLSDENGEVLLSSIKMLILRLSRIDLLDNGVGQRTCRQLHGEWVSNLVLLLACNPLLLADMAWLSRCSAAFVDISDVNLFPSDWGQLFL